MWEINKLIFVLYIKLYKTIKFFTLRKIIAGNWKMYKTIHEADTTIAALTSHLTNNPTPNSIYIAAPLPYLDRLIKKYGNSQVIFGAQNLNEHDEGAYTGEVSGKMLYSLDCKFVIIGHSERRQYFEETDIIIHQKILAAFRNLLQPVFCCGEKLEERNGEIHFNVIKRQIEEGLFALSGESVLKLIIAYEPVWAIGTGVNASPEQAQQMHNFIRNLIKDKYGENVSSAVPILYGGSVKPNNAAALFQQADIDGALIGGASLLAEDLIKIIEAA